MFGLVYITPLPPKWVDDHFPIPDWLWALIFWGTLIGTPISIIVWWIS